MSWLILALVALMLLVMEKMWTPAAMKSLSCLMDCDCEMAEPGQAIAWTTTVQNKGKLPVPFVRVRLTFPEKMVFLGDPKWINSHCQKGIYQWHEEEIVSLFPHQSCSRGFRFALPQRGEYFLGKYMLSIGDLLGFRETKVFEEGKRIVIIPNKTRNEKQLVALGGFLGDISVRRFIMEDPVLTTGFRDYTGAEPMKAISWTRTATAETLQVKQFDHTAERNVTVILNTEGGSAEQLEECFRLTRSVCEALERDKIPFGLRTNGNLPGPVGNIFSLAEGLGSRHLHTILYALGMADYTCFHSFRYLVDQTVRHRKNNEFYIVISPNRSEEALEGMRFLEKYSGNGILRLFAEAEVTQ